MKEKVEIEIKGKSFKSGDLNQQKELIKLPCHIESSFQLSFTLSNSTLHGSSKNDRS